MAGQKRAEIEKINLRLQKLLDSFLDGVIDRDTFTAEKAKGMSQKKSLEEQIKLVEWCALQGSNLRPLQCE